MSAPYCKHFSSLCRLRHKNAVCALRSMKDTILKRQISSCQIFVESYGDPKHVVRFKTSEIPSKLAAREILVKMMMAPINPSDINMIEGTYFIQPQVPAILGNEGVGEIVSVGSEVRGLDKGDWVLPADAAWGTWQNFKVSNEEDVIKIPNDIPQLSAATLSVNPCTAYRMLKDYVQLKEGDVIIQNGANSGVGVSVIQLAKEWGLKTINVVRNRQDFPKLEQYLLSLGASHVVTEEFMRKPEMKSLVKEIGKKPKLALNCVGGKSATELIRYLDNGGFMVTYGGMSRKPIMAPTGPLIFREITLCGYWNTRWNQLNAGGLKRLEMLSDLCKLIKEGKFEPPKCEFYSLEDYQSAINQATEGFKAGKMVFKME